MVKRNFLLIAIIVKIAKLLSIINLIIMMLIDNYGQFIGNC